MKMAMSLVPILFSLLSLPLSIFGQSTNSTNARITQDNPLNTTFSATLQADKPIQGTITGTSNENGTGVFFNVDFHNFPYDIAGPYKYHIHLLPVPLSGNCTATGGHLSPYGRNDTPECDPREPQTCQPGDLSGKHGSIDLALNSNINPNGTNDGDGNNHNNISNTSGAPSFLASYLDLYLSTNDLDWSFFGNRSVVVHAGNGTRLNCGNFTLVRAARAGDNATATTTTTAPGASITEGTATTTATGADTAAASTSSGSSTTAANISTSTGGASGSFDTSRLGGVLAWELFAVVLLLPLL